MGSLPLVGVWGRLVPSKPPLPVHPSPTHRPQVDEAEFACQALDLPVTLGHPDGPAADIDGGSDRGPPHSPGADESQGQDPEQPQRNWGGPHGDGAGAGGGACAKPLPPAKPPSGPRRPLSPRRHSNAEGFDSQGALWLLSQDGREDLTEAGQGRTPARLPQTHTLGSLSFPICTTTRL